MNKTNHDQDIKKPTPPQVSYDKPNKQHDRVIHLHESVHDSSIPQDSNDKEDVDIVSPPNDNNINMLINAAKSRGKHPNVDVRQLLSDSNTVPSNSNLNSSFKTPKKSHEQHPHFSANMTSITYSVSTSIHSDGGGALVDRGANGGIAGCDMRVIARTDRTVDISGIDNHQVKDLNIVTAGGVVESQRGPVILIFHQMAHSPLGKTILSSIQMEHFKLNVDDRSTKAGGKQSIHTVDGFTMPLTFRQGLPYLDVRPHTDKEYQELPHVIMTSDINWDPTCMDSDRHNQGWLRAQPNVDSVEHIHHPFDSQGAYIENSHVQHQATHSTPVCTDWAVHYTSLRLLGDEIEDIQIHQTQVVPAKKDYNDYKRFFLHSNDDVIKHTFDNTTQYARSGWITGRISDTHRAPFPALNVHRRNEPVATDTVYADVPALGSGSTCAQFFVGCESVVSDVYGMNSDGQFVNRLLDNIRKRGAMNQLISDRAQAEISKKVVDVLRHLCIDDWQSEPHYQHQNFAERRYREVKHKTNRVLNATGAPDNLWLLCMEYVCFILNRMSLRSKNWKTPLELLSGTTPDISMIYRFCFWDRVYFGNENSNFPSDSDERSGRFVGFSEHVGHQMTYRILADDTGIVMYRSRVHLAGEGENLRLQTDDSTHESTLHTDDVGFDTNDNDFNHHHQAVPLNPHVLDKEFQPGGEIDDDDIQSIPTTTSERKIIHEDNEHRPLAVIDADDIIGRSYLSIPKEDGSRTRLRIVEALEDHDKNVTSSADMKKFRSLNSEDTVEEIISYNELLDRLEADDGADDIWKFTAITDHYGPMTTSDQHYNGSSYNVQVNWENGEITWEPLTLIAKSDPVTCAIYAKDNNLLDLPGWRQFRSIAQRQKKFVRMVNQTKLKAFRNATIYKFGVKVPRNHYQAMKIDKENGNTMWQEAEGLEFIQIDEYETFLDLGRGAAAPTGYKKITVHMVYDVKHDGRRKARLVAGGYLTETPLESVYSGVVSLRGLRLVIFLGELNGMKTWATDVGNAYLEAKTREKVYVIGGPEFTNREGHTLIIQRALYGLKLSGKMWSERSADIFREMGFVASRTEDDIWMRDKGDHYEYIARYVDDLAIVSQDPAAIIKALTDTYKLKLKGTGPIGYHLGCDFYRDSHGVLCMSPKKYIEKMVLNYEMMFGCKPTQKCLSPLEANDHPELDTSPELDTDGIQKYQSLIGAIQWSVSIGRLDVATAVMTMSKFRAAPRKGHLERVKRMVGYLSKMNEATIRFRVGKPDMSAFKRADYGWEQSVYGDCKELIPEDIPEPKGEVITMISFVDANLMHDVLTGRSVTGVIHLLNKTPIDYFSKKQSTVETATYGSEFVAARTATEQIMDLRLTLRYLGAGIDDRTYMFGDNETVVSSASIPHSKLHKRHVLLSFHRVREAIASKMLEFLHIPGKQNPADILSKCWGYQQVKSLLKPLLFWEGNTGDLM